MIESFDEFMWTALNIRTHITFFLSHLIEKLSTEVTSIESAIDFSAELNLFT